MDKIISREIATRICSDLMVNRHDWKVCEGSEGTYLQNHFLIIVVDTGEVRLNQEGEDSALEDLHYDDTLRIREVAYDLAYDRERFFQRVYASSKLIRHYKI